MKIKKIKNIILTFVICLFGAFAFNDLKVNASTYYSNGVVSVDGRLDANNNIISNNFIDASTFDNSYGNGSLVVSRSNLSTGIITINGSISSAYGLGINLPDIYHVESGENYILFINHVGGTCSSANSNYCIGINANASVGVPFTWVDSGVLPSFSGTSIIGANNVNNAYVGLWIETSGTSSVGTTTFDNFQFYFMLLKQTDYSRNRAVSYSNYASIIYYSSISADIAGAYTAGFDTGFDFGYSEGFSTGEDVGYDNGFLAGEDVGYERGYNFGFSYASRESNTLIGMVGAIFTGPVTMLQSIFNFDILGINFVEMLLGLTTLLVVIWLIKRFI